mmetsp:Transcript_5568/g.13745  ORF Transcript_5568/g.13745 Transcript_5568/m.13745 type:complete len:525 (+) Transcript_5568:420-1994(+)
MIEPAYGNKFVVRQRQKLKTARQADRFCAQLQDRIEKERTKGEVLIFEDFDISQNRLPAEQLEGIFSALADGGVHVERFRAFGCPTLDDQAATLLAGWLAGVTKENVPFELHLSDCAITADGFRDLMKAFEENDAFPAPDPKFPNRGLLPIYLRLENNYIEESAMRQSIDDGVAVKMRKGDSLKFAESVKVRLLVREDGSFQQKKGDPPKPEDVPAPRPFREKGKGKGEKGREGWGSSGWGKGSGKDSRSSGKGSKGRDKGKSGGKGKDRDRDRDVRPPWQALPAPRSTVAATRRPTEASRARPKRELCSPPPPPKGRGKDRGPSSYSSSKSYDSYDSKSYDSGARGKGAGNTAPYNAFSRGSSAGNSTWDRPSTSGGKGDRNINRPPPAKRGADIWDRDDGAEKRQKSGFQPSKPSSNNSGGYNSRGAVSGSNTGGTRPSSAFDRKPAAGGKGGSGGGKSGRSGASDKSPLPYPWEEHWSDEYQLHYYWNSKTGASMWERPRASDGAGGGRTKGAKGTKGGKR